MADDAYECMIYDADFPSMSVRFLVPKGFLVAGGIYEIRRLRSATEADEEKFSGRKDPPDYVE